MDKEKIANSLKENHIRFLDFVDALTQNQYEYSWNKKWTASMHCDHILKSITTLNKVLLIPKWILKLKFGTANRASKSYDEFVEKYLERLKSAKPTTKDFQPNNVLFSKKNALLNGINKANEKLINQLNKLSENDLDNYILPHPLMGKQTLREFFYFTMYHVSQHKNFIIRDLNQFE